MRCNPVAPIRKPSAARKTRKGEQEKVTATYSRPLADWPLARPGYWVDLVNEPQSESELAALRHCFQRDCPYGNEAWAATTAKQLGLESTLRPRGRPKKPSCD